MTKQTITPTKPTKPTEYAKDVQAGLLSRGYNFSIGILKDTGQSVQAKADEIVAMLVRLKRILRM